MSYLDQFKRDNPGIEKYTDDEILAVLPDIDPALRDMSPDEVKSFATSSAPSGLGSIIKSGYDSVMGNRDIKKGVSQVSDLNDPEFSDLEKGYNENSSLLGISGDKLRRKTKAATGKTDELYNEAQGYLDSGAESLQKAGSVTLSPSTQKFLNDESESSWLSDFLDDPITIITEIGAQSAYGSLESLASGVAGAAAAGPAGLAVGAGAGSARVEFASSFVESLKEAGVDLSDARNLQVALQENPDLYRSATEEALVRSGIIGAADAATMGLATKSLGLGSGLTKQVSNAAAQGVVQTGGGAAGEAGAQLAVDGEISSPRQVAAEAVGELVTAPVDIAAGSYTAARELKQGAQPQPDETPADPVQSNIDDINQFKDSLTAQEMGLSMPEPVDYSQYDQPSVNRVGEQLDGLSEIEQAIRIAEKEGFADEAVRLNTAKSYFDKAELARQQGMESVTGEFSEKGNAIYRDVMEQPLPEQQARPDQFPEPYVSEGEIQGGELTTVDQPQAEMEPTPDIEGQSQEIPQEQLPPGTNQINQGYERPERQFSPVDPLYEGVGQNVVERQAGDKQALPPANPARSITPDQLQSLQKIRGVALRTKIRERTPEQVEAIQIVEAVKAGEVEVSNDRSDNAGNGVYRGNEGAPSNNTEGSNGNSKVDLSSQAASTQLPELPGTLEASSNADSSMGAGREANDSTLDVSLNAKGLPYVSEKSAKASKAYRSNKEAAKVVPVEGGFGIATPKAEQRKTSKPSDGDLSVVSESLSYAESKAQVNDLRTNNQNDQFFVRPNKATKGKFDIYTDGKATKPEAAVITEPVVKQTPVKPAEASENADITETASKGDPAVFKPDSGTLNIPRSEMPQIKAEHRGAMVNFMNARGIKHDQADVDPLTLKPTQADFVPEKVKAAKEYKGGDRSILISSDNHVLDGHHQWLAKRESGQPIKAIKLDAPIADLVPLANEFPSSENEQSNESNQNSKKTMATAKENQPSNNQAAAKQTKPKAKPKPAKTVSPKFSRTKQSEPTIPLTKSNDQSEAKFLGNHLSRYFNDEQWKNAFASYALPDSLDRFGSAVQAAFGKRVAAVMPTERKYDILDGMHIPGHESIFVNPSNRVSFVAVTGHELYHHIAKSRPDLHKWLVGKLQSQVDSDRFEAYRERLDALIQKGEALHSDAQIQEELLADLMGDAMTDKPFLEALAKDNPTYFRRLVNVINIYLNKLKGKLKGLGSKQYFNDVSAMQKHLREVLNAYANDTDINEVTEPSTSAENVVELAKYQEEKAAFFEWIREQKEAQKAGNFSRGDAVSSGKNQMVDSMESNNLTDSDLWDRSKIAEGKGYDRVFTHASPSKEFVIPSKRSAFENFDGIFLSEGIDSSYSHGEYQHRYVVSSDKVARERDVDLDYDQSIAFIKSKFPDMTDEQVDAVYNFTAGDENVYDSEENPLEDYGYPEVHEASWEYQNIRGLIAKDQGFDAIAMNDEFGVSYFIPEGSGAKNLLDPEFDFPSSGNTRQQDQSSFSRQAQETEQEPQPVAETFAIPTGGLVASGIRKIADKFKVLKDLQANIKATGAEIDETADAYMAEELFHGKAENDLRQMRQTFVEPLAKKMADFGITQAELDKYLYAKHAAERNDHIAEINPDLQDGGSGMTNAEASEIISNVELSGKANQYEQVAAIVYDMLAAKRDQIRAAGLEDSDVVDAWEASYQHYVPLKGYAADETQDGLPRSGKGFTIGGKESKRALGRTSEAASPSSYAISDLTETLIRKRKNEVGNAFLNLVEANPNSDYWQVFTDENPETDRRIVKSKDPLTGKTIETGYFTTKRDGVTHYIKLEDPRLLKAMNNIEPDTSNFVIQGLAKANRWLSAVNTSYNPEFVVGNFARDIQTAALNLSAEQTRDDGKAKGEKIVKQTIKDVPKAMKAVYRSMRGKPAKNAEWANYFEEFQADGAKTGYFDMKDIDGQAKDVQRLIDISKGGFKGGFYKWTQAAGKLVEDTNSSVENAVRLSAYVNARKAGISRAKAASLAKNMTVNFNRRGEMGTTLNALYMFANASIQGSMNFARTMIGLNGEKGDPVWSRLNKAQKISIGIMAGSYAFAMANRMGAGEDDDGENWYDKVPQYVKERNLVIMKSLLGGDADGSYYKIPLPYGYNIFHVFGTSMESAVDDPRKTGQAATDLMLAALGSFSPIGFQDSNSTTGTILKNLTPTIGKPVVDVAMNENFMGGSIYNENFPFGTPKPESSLSRRSTPEAYKAVAEFLNEQTGGSQWRSGGIDINPDVMRYFVDYALGGSGKFFLNKAPSNLTGMVDGVQPDISRVMFLSRVNGKVLPYEDQSKFYDRRDEIKQIVDEVKETRGPEKAKLLAEYSGKLRLLGMIKATESQLKILRKHRNAIYNEDLTPKSRDEKLKAVELKMKTVVDRFNKAYKEADQR